MDTGNDQTGQTGSISVLNEEIQSRLLTQLSPLRRTMDQPIVRSDTKTARGLIVDEVLIG
ncbi:hypothetical protein SynA1524_01456 [Synechococcus sp. A15-24]|nr:hypothetical protein SynA1524_01456 [Synechococcus sp. A15-24]